MQENKSGCFILDTVYIATWELLTILFQLLVHIFDLKPRNSILLDLQFHTLSRELQELGVSDRESYYAILSTMHSKSNVIIFIALTCYSTTSIKMG